MLNVRIQKPEVKKLSPKITVIGVGGAGGNAVNNMISSALEGCEFLVCNTDAQALEGSLCDHRLQLGASVTGGLGAGAKPEIGERAAQESLSEVMEYLEGSNMAFITAGMGGGTGTGAAPVIAKACRDAGILTVGVVTKPFHFEGTHRMTQAEAGIEEMQDYVDTLIVIPNQNLFRVANEKTTFAEAFKMADGVLQSGVRGVTDLMVMPGLINLDFADIRSAMLEMGKAMMGNGEAEGDRRATDAAEAAINNPLLDDVSMKGARGVIINVTGGHDMTLFEVDEACNRIRDEVDPNANIIFGSTFDEKLEGSMRVSVVATGIDMEEAVKQPTNHGVKTTTIAKAAESQTQTESSKTLLERAIPQTEVVQKMTAQSRKVEVTKAQAPIVTKKEEPESDMLEQSEFIQAPASPAPKTSSMTQSQIYQGNFIPPSPIVPERQDEVRQSSPSYAPSQQAARVMSQPQPQPQQQVSQVEAVSSSETMNQSQSGLVLRPPVPGAAQAERKKTPSLFERITGVYRDNGQETSSQPQESAPSGQGGFHSGLRAERPLTNPSQGQLNIDSPSAERPKGEEDLDIPAFLRRQAN
jgi:cell division protein FtsZ